MELVGVQTGVAGAKEVAAAEIVGEIAGVMAVETPVEVAVDLGVVITVVGTIAVPVIVVVHLVVQAGQAAALQLDVVLVDSDRAVNLYQKQKGITEMVMPFCNIMRIVIL